MATTSHAPAPATAGGSHAHGDHPLVGHLVPIGTLVATGTALLVLTVITVAVRYIDIGEFNIWVAIIVAVIKGTLVATFFMHLRWDRPFNVLVFVGSVLFVVLLMGFCMMDSKQYERLILPGNPQRVKETLDVVAPDAPIAAQDE